MAETCSSCLCAWRAQLHIRGVEGRRCEKEAGGKGRVRQSSAWRAPQHPAPQRPTLQHPAPQPPGPSPRPAAASKHPGDSGEEVTHPLCPCEMRALSPCSPRAPVAPASRAASRRLGAVACTVLGASIQSSRSQDLVLVSQPKPCTCACLLKAGLASWGGGEQLFITCSSAMELGERCLQ